jgi:tight adherence protein B
VIPAVLLTILVFALVGQAAWLVTDAWRERDPVTTPVARRIIDYTRITWETKSADATSILRRERLSRFAWLDHLLQRFDVAQRLSSDLRNAGKSMHAAEFLALQLALTLIAGAVGFVALAGVFGPLPPAAAGAVVGFVAPIAWLRKAGGSRRKRFEQELPDALDLLTGSLRAGYSIPDGMEIVAREGTGPCAEEFQAVIKELNIGADLDAALAHFVERMPTEDARLFVAALTVQRRTGGNLVDVLKQLTRTLRERRRLRDDVHVLTTGPRMSGYVGAALPYVMLVATYFLNHKSFELLVNEPTGRLTILASTFLVALGLFLNNRVAKVDV